MRWFRNQTIRWRITIWSVLIAAVLVALAAFAFLVVVKGIVANETQAVLTSFGAPYRAGIEAGTTTRFATPGEGQLIAIVDPTGTVRITNLPASLNNKMASLLKLRDGVHSISGDEGLRYDVSVEGTIAPRSSNGAARVWKIVAARNAASGEAVLDSLQTVLIGGGVALVLGFGVAAWIVSGLALRPVTRMRQQASRLSQSPSADILPVGDVHDELSALAETLNDFIRSVRASADRERQMVADASHELRTPIAVLTTQLQLAHLSAGDAAALEREIGSAEATLERLASLTTNLLTLSRIEAAEGADPEAVTHTDSDAIVAEFLACMDRGIILGSTNGVKVEFATDGVSPLGTVPIPAADFGRLVDNLVSNAIAASPRGGEVEASLTQRGHVLTLSVVDSGHGIDSDFLPVAFDRFSRAERSRGSSPARGIGGSGLGLAIVRAIVTRAGGVVRLEARPESGVRAVAELPVVPRGARINM